jgi:hypothetical protein
MGPARSMVSQPKTKTISTPYKVRVDTPTGREEKHEREEEAEEGCRAQQEPEESSKPDC